MYVKISLRAIIAKTFVSSGDLYWGFAPAIPEAEMQTSQLQNQGKTGGKQPHHHPCSPRWSQQCHSPRDITKAFFFSSLASLSPSIVMPPSRKSKQSHPRQSKLCWGQRRRADHPHPQGFHLNSMPDCSPTKAHHHQDTMVSLIDWTVMAWSADFMASGSSVISMSPFPHSDAY